MTRSCLAVCAVLVGCNAPVAPKPVDAKAKVEAKVTDAKAKPEVKAKPDAKADDGRKQPPDITPTTAMPPPVLSADRQWSFDAETPGALAAGFVAKQTGELVTPAATWAVVDDATAPSGGRAFGVTKTAGTNKTFNVALIEGTSYRDLEISVMLRPTAGTNNKGGGVVFRAKGENDYYVARWNPVENNFRIYALLGGARVDLAAAPLELDADAWHNLRVVVTGDTIECFVDDASVARATDKALPNAGMIGLWTKGDAATLFDDLTVDAVGPEPTK